MALLQGKKKSWEQTRFPPYELMDPEHVRKSHEEHRRLENLYHKTQNFSWDGKKILAELIEKHGGVNLPEDKKRAIGEVFAIILWGELAAWQVSAYLADHIPQIEAKLAATGQVFDEARHFYTMRDYLLELGIPQPRINWFTRVVLDYLLKTDNLVYKLVGMQLLVENIAVHLFKNVAEINVEPVLTDLMPYFEKDEARHVGLGVMYLPELLRELGPVEQAKLAVFQAFVYGMVVLGGYSLMPEFEKLGINVNRWLRRMGHDQSDITYRMGRYKDRKGVVIMPKFFHKINRAVIDLFVPENPESANLAIKGINKVLIAATATVARIGDRLAA